MILKSNHVSSRWYKAAYNDVFKSGIQPKIHYLKYGENENRYRSAAEFINQKGEYYKPLWINFIIHFLFSILLQDKFKKIIFNLIIFFQLKKLKKFHFDSILVTSWLRDGVEEALSRYIKLQSKDKEIVVLRGVKNFGDLYSSPMIVEIWKDNRVLYKNGFLFPIETFLEKIGQSTFKFKIHIHHFYDIEDNVLNLIRNCNLDLFFYVHDYYIFTKNWHLYSKTSNLQNLDYFISNFPNDKISLKELEKKFKLFICPSKNVYLQISKHISKNKLYWVYLPEESNIEFKEVKDIVQRKVFKILIIGNLGDYKGQECIKSIINICIDQNLPYRFIHFGRGNLNFQSDKYINIKGLTRVDMLNEASKLNMDFALLPFLAQETYSFTLSDIMLLGLPLISTSVGAIPERCLGRKKTILLNKKSNAHDYIKVFKFLVSNNYKELNIKVPIDLYEKRTRNPSLYYFCN